uniref:Carboxylic ester hydrolase n=1 Tax=Scolopendra viridis TaxID=118503 RepID=A0A4D5R9B5_SCOVI
MKILQSVILSIIYYFILSRADDSSDDFVVHLSTGSVRGKIAKGENGNEFYSFRRIPYAEPPVGNLRFKPPVSKISWNGVLDATEDGPSCTQLNFFTKEYEGQEDCLYLNVYTPKLPKDKENLKMDVVYWINGGGFLAMAGTSAYAGPERFPLQDDVILVSVTYRINVMGFLSTNDSASPGNYGLLDQVEGLKWVRENIHYFGGDPNKVTIMGESAGGASVIYQMLTPLTKGLFHRAIAMSGSALCSWARQKVPLYWSKKLGEDIGCPTESSCELVNCLRQKPVEEIIHKGNFSFYGLPPITNAPVVDNYFIEDTPLNLIKQKKYHTDVPLIIGITKDEGTFFLLGRNASVDFTDDEINNSLKQAIDVLPNVDDKIKLIRAKYSDNPKSYSDEDVISYLGPILNDGFFHKCVLHTAEEMIKSGTKTYFYKYDYEAPFSASEFAHRPPKYGAVHMDDLFMFFTGIYKEANFDETSTVMKNKFQNLFINFIKSGKPNADSEVDCEWPQAKPNELSICHININCSISVYDQAKDPSYNFWINEINKA